MNNRFSKDIRNGNVMSVGMKRALFAYLGVEFGLYTIFFRMIIFFLIAIIGLLIAVNSLLGLLIYGCFVLLGAVIYLFMVLKRKDKYLEDIQYYYESKYAEYAEMQRFYTYQLDSTAARLKNSVLFFSDGYYFYVFDDPLISTGICLGRRFRNTYNPTPMLKVYDEDSINQPPFSFKLNDILYYELIGEYMVDPNHSLKEELIHIFPYGIEKNYVQITFSNFKVLQLGSNVYSFLKEILPLKEILANEK